MTSLAKQARKSIKRMASHYRDGTWSGESPNELLARWRNCRLATVDDLGGLYVEDPQRGHFLDDYRAIQFVAWLESEGVTIDDEDDATDGPDPVADADLLCPDAEGGAR